MDPDVRVAAIIPAFNEAGTVRGVVEVARSAACIDEVLVVDNASEDDTGRVAAAAGARVVHCARKGKGQAMRAGVEFTDAQIICFLDADLLNLTTDMVDRLVEPVRAGQAAMTMCLFDRGPEMNPVFLNVLPKLTGQRAMRRELFAALSPHDIKGYKVEAALNSLVEERGLPTEAFVGEGLWHRTKEEKMDNPVVGHTRKVAMLGTAVWSYISYAAVRPVREKLAGARGDRTSV
ncbi:MAG TPA: glycosyltransferase [Nitriliruptorales bacterium]